MSTSYNTSDTAVTTNFGFKIPEGFSWAAPFVIKCDRCKKSKDCREPGELYVTGQDDFIALHRACIADAGVKPLSSLTIRQEFAVRILAALIASGRDDEDATPEIALAIANRLIAKL